MDKITDDISRRRSHADVATASASRYLQQLCKHFSHKVDVAFDDRAGSVAFSIGNCRLIAQEGMLQIALDAPDAEALSELQQVVASHLARFAFREELSIDWRTG